MYGENDQAVSPVPRLPKRRPNLQNYGELYSTPTIVSNVLTLDINTSQHFLVSLNANITTLTFKNVRSLTPAIPGFGILQGIVVIFTADGTARTITWGASVLWAGGSAPTMTSTNGKRDAVVFNCLNGSSTILAALIGQNF